VMGELLTAFACAWDAIRARHDEVPPVVLVTGPCLHPGAERRKLGHFRAVGWGPPDDGGRSELEAAIRVVDDLIESGDVTALGDALSTSAEATLRSAAQLCHDAHQFVGEVFITSDGLALPPSDLLAIVLREAAYSLASERGVKDTSRQGRYHNQRFKAIAEELGLEVSRDPPFGCSRTSLTAAAAATYSQTLESLGLALSRLHDSQPSATAPRPGRGAKRNATSFDCECGLRIREGGRASGVRAAICTRCNSWAERR
jgi:hypothetical protein